MAKKSEEKPKAKRKRLLKKCWEFSCYEMPDGTRRLILSEDFEDACDRARFGISDAGQRWKERLSLARALLSLAEYKAGQPVPGKQLLESLADTLGQCVLEVLNTPPQKVPVSKEKQAALAPFSMNGKPAKWTISPEATALAAEARVESIGATVRNAALALKRWKFRLPKWERVIAIQDEAKRIFLEELRRPTKQEIRIMLDSEAKAQAEAEAGGGEKAEFHALKGKNAKDQWREAFRLAGLENLPER